MPQCMQGQADHELFISQLCVDGRPHNTGPQANHPPSETQESRSTSLSQRHFGKQLSTSSGLINLACKGTIEINVKLTSKKYS